LHAALEQAVAYSVGDRQIVVVARGSLRMLSLKEKQVITNGAAQRLRFKRIDDLMVKQRAIDRMRAGLVVDPSKDDTAEIAEVWRKCNDESAKVPQDDLTGSMRPSCATSSVTGMLRYLSS
jgi:hypothetical protein